MTSLAIAWDLIGDAALAIAVSGGADSFALLHACAERGLPVVALTVDHGLRDGSAEDARIVAAWCEGRGIPHETLRWEGEKPETGIQDTARTARYRLLCDACERMGLDRLATGHTLDDQAETVFMRLRRGAGRGLAGMPPSRKIASGPGEPVTLLRPMLGVRRAEARTYTEAHGLPLRDDPSNEDEGFERVRVRALLGALEEQGLLTAEALGRTADRLRFVNQVIREGLGWRFPIDPWDDASEMFWTLNDGTVVLQKERLSQSNAAILVQMGSAAVTDVAMNDTDAVAVVGTQFAGENSRANEFKAALNGAVFQIDWNSDLLIYREPAALLGRADGTPGLDPIPAPPSTKHLYDRRFIVTVPGDVPPGTELRPLGQLLPRDIATSTLARARVSTLPCLARGGVVTHLPAAAIRAVREAWGGWKRAGAVMPRLGDDDAVFEARSLLAERFANEVIRY